MKFTKVEFTKQSLPNGFNQIEIHDVAEVDNEALKELLRIGAAVPMETEDVRQPTIGRLYGVSVVSGGRVERTCN